MTLLGEAGLRDLAAINHAGAVAAAERLAQVPGVMLINDAFFNEFTLELSKEARPVVRALADRGVLAGVRSEEHTSELQSLMRISYAVSCLETKKKMKYKNI